MKNKRLLFGKINLSIADAKYFKHWPAGFALGMAFLLGPAYGEDIQKEKSVMVTESLEQRGKQLRVALEQAYQKMVDEKTLSARPMAGNEVTDVVVRYIPIGTTFDDAESILRSAGFSVDSRPSASTDINLHGDVVGAIIPFAQKFISSVNLYVRLSPAVLGDFSKVSKVYAGFIVITI
jgi:hypothetical protein